MNFRGGYTPSPENQQQPGSHTMRTRCASLDLQSLRLPNSVQPES